MWKASTYLAGPIDQATWEGATEWRKQAEFYLLNCGVKCLDPMRGKERLFADMGAKDTFESTEYPDDPWTTSKGITRRDRQDVRICDILLANFTDAKKVSIGTTLEIGWADAMGKYIIVIMDEKNPHWHGMVCEVADLIVPSLEEALQRIAILVGA